MGNAVIPWLEQLLKERFCPELRLSTDLGRVRLMLSGLEGRILFDRRNVACLENGLGSGCESWDPETEGWESAIGLTLPAPGNAKLEGPLIERDNKGYVVHYDILGLTYWMLSRIEEIGRRDLDAHGRFPATASHAFRHEYLDRPIVDEWMHILGQVIERQWPRVKLKENIFEVKVSHDVDRPSRYAFGGLGQLGRRIAGDVVKRRELSSAVRGPLVRWRTRDRLDEADPYNNFEWIMEVSERYGLASAFYFIAGRTDPRKDGDYEVEDPAIRHLLRRIHTRGHEIGLHPSYATYRSADLVAREADRLRRVCAEEGIRQEKWGGRMHYLRWEQPTTLRAWEAAGMTYDSTMTYADHAGFRCGTCFEYPAFDAVAGQPLNLRIRPLIAMECSVLGDQYMGLKKSDALDEFAKLKERCRAVRGAFSLLWHNSELRTPDERLLYESVLSV
ncbi:polysaccharide deacetylase family protein [Thioalkalivibrio paradoxus]|uniref:polysaccharide deacetylase family protein n=1 Tax=Thioalkalivibrio paradoxus TaxID=108010 RepID=UPI00059D7205|nr:polysaccharide deacetylase family protein [Thioalkalivibrio paradoxus]